MRRYRYAEPALWDVMVVAVVMAAMMLSGGTHTGGEQRPCRWCRPRQGGEVQDGVTLPQPTP